MADSRPISLDRLLIVGVNRRRLPAELAEGFFASEPDVSGLLAGIAGVQPHESMVIATCERLEYLLARGESWGQVETIAELIAQQGDCAVSQIAPYLYTHEGDLAVRHLFEVAASLDSEVPGEPHVLGQIKTCHAAAGTRGMTGPLLEALLQSAYGAAKRARHETPIAERSVSMAAVAGQLLRRLHGEIADCRILLAGLGEMAELLGSEFQQLGATQFMVMHGNLRRAESLALRLGGHYRAWEELEDALAQAEVVVCDRGLGQFTVTGQMAKTALSRRKQRPILFLDVALPGDVEEEVDRLADAFVYRLDDLERIALEGKASREAAMVMARSLLEDERIRFIRQWAERGAGEPISELKAHFERLRREALAESPDDADVATQRLVQRLLHDPAQALRGSAAEGREAGASFSETVRRLFGLGRKSRGDDQKESDG